MINNALVTNMIKERIREIYKRNELILKDAEVYISQYDDESANIELCVLDYEPIVIDLKLMPVDEILQLSEHVDVVDIFKTEFEKMKCKILSRDEWKQRRYDLYGICKFSALTPTAKVTAITNLQCGLKGVFSETIDTKTAVSACLEAEDDFYYFADGSDHYLNGSELLANI